MTHATARSDRAHVAAIFSFLRTLGDADRAARQRVLDAVEAHAYRGDDSALKNRIAFERLRGSGLV